MDRREVLLEQLGRVTRHVQVGQRAIAREHKVVTDGLRDGHDVAGAEELLARLEELQKLHLEHLELIRQELEQTLTPR